MQGRVIRNGKHSGGDHFVEVQDTPSSPPYAFPVNTEIPLGSLVEVTIKVVEVPPAPAQELVNTDVSASSKPQLVVPTSPFAGNEPLKDTAPSGQTEPTAPELNNAGRAERTKGNDTGIEWAGKNQGAGTLPPPDDTGLRANSKITESETVKSSPDFPAKEAKSRV